MADVTYVKALTTDPVTGPIIPDLTDRGGEFWTPIPGGGSGVGTVTTVSVASANGFTGTVANATTTPAITIRTSITGLLKGNGTAVSAAVAGTDYYAPGGTDIPITDGGTGASTATQALINLGFTATITELNYTDGVTSAIQTQLDAKGTGNVSKVGTPTDNQIGVWTGDGTIEGTAALTFSTSTLTLGSGAASGVVSSNGNFDLVLQTGNATTGTITITDGASGAITLQPNGSGAIEIGGRLDLNGNNIQQAGRELLGGRCL